MRCSLICSIGLLGALLLCECAFGGDDSVFVAKLRAQMKFPFILDFLVQDSVEAKYSDRSGERFISEWSRDPRAFGLREHSDSMVVEQFRYYHSYKLLRVRSTTGDRHYLLLERGFDRDINELWLFADSVDWALLLDTLSLFGYQGVQLEPMLLNGKNMFRLSRELTGTGALRQEESFVSIEHGKIQFLYTVATYERWSMDWVTGYTHDTTDENYGKFMRRVSTYNLMDLNGDGFLDIREVVVDDMIDFGEEERVMKTFSRREFKFLWNESKLTFARTE